MSASSAIKNAPRKLAEAESGIAGSLPRNGGVARLLDTVGGLGDQPELRIISCATLGAGLLTGNARLARAGMRMLVAHEVATLAKDFVKRRIDRKRPRSADHPRKAVPRPGRSEAKEDTSFPSGHTAGSVAVAQAFAREFPEYRAPALAAAGLVAVAQIPRDAHYPTDVAAGAIIGAAAEALIGQLWPGNLDG